MKPSSIALLPLLLACASEAPEPVMSPVPVRFAALPLVNLTTDANASKVVLNELRLKLGGSGAVFVPNSQIEEVMRAHRIRYTDSLSQEAAQAIAEQTGAQYVLAGTLLAYAPGPQPRASLAIRLIDAHNGKRDRSVTCSLRGADFVGLLGLGAITDVSELLDEVIVRVIDGFALDWASAATVSHDAMDQRAPGSSSAGVLVHFHQEGFAATEIGRLAILPLVNQTDRLDASELFQEVLADQCQHALGTEIIERAEVLAVMRREKIRSIQDLDLVLLGKLSKGLATRFFVLGSVDLYREEVPVGREHLPEIEASLRLFDAEQERVVAAASVHRRGDDYHWALGFKIERDPVRLFTSVARELVAALSE